MREKYDLYPAIKRALDISFSSSGLLFLAPLLLIIAVLISLDTEGPVFYRGVRVGQGGVPFRIYKFRTMVADAEKLGASSTPADDERITRVGKHLRKYKLDELPQLLNVLKGEMSLVGPRPQVKWAVELYTPEERRVLTVRPGITDYASLAFPNESEILRGSEEPDKEYMEKIHPRKMQLSLEYLDSHSIWTDIKVIMKTIAVILRR